MKLKAKKTAYFLLPIVLLILGTVFYRVFFEGSEELQPEPLAMADLAENEMHTGPDTFSLYLDYPDPFLKRNTVVRKKTKPRKKKPAPKKEKKKKVKWPSVAYGGMIKNQASDKSLAMINVQGKDKLMQEGDAVGLLQIKKI